MLVKVVDNSPVEIIEMRDEMIKEHDTWAVTGRSVIQINAEIMQQF